MQQTFNLDYEALAESIRAQMANKKLSLRSAAREIGVSASALHYTIEGSRTPTVATLLQICGWLGSPPGTFFNDVEGDALAAEIDSAEAAVERAAWKNHSAPEKLPEIPWCECREIAARETEEDGS